MEEEAQEEELDCELNDLDAGDIESLETLAKMIDSARKAWLDELDRTGTLSQVKEDHFRRAFGPRPASRATTPAWPLQPRPETPWDPIEDMLDDSEIDDYEPQSRLTTPAR